ncbi:TOBE domain-containing protein [Rhodococcus opacus]|uniref:TOBE domain-containing protein n=1 Tax=Rhodococcus opacus TaxID=37919 RepID=UPI000EAA64B7|nr:helix-turn-helix transcriptional regulator [Rhodococcus opacus]QZS52573.1 helix-turn-helix transcriptional regulator [Rhodococcus opacus]RKM64880.1 MerR family transcriptional regulator [Rhodococcus opacus]
MSPIQIKGAADLLGVSDDTVRRWIDNGNLPAIKDASGRTVLDGKDLAAFAHTHASPPPTDPQGVASSARNRFVGLVTKVTVDEVMSSVEMQCGPFTVVALTGSDAVRELGLEPGRVAVAVVEATTVIVEIPSGTS